MAFNARSHSLKLLECCLIFGGFSTLGLSNGTSTDYSQAGQSPSQVQGPISSYQHSQLTAYKTVSASISSLTLTQQGSSGPAETKAFTSTINLNHFFGFEDSIKPITVFKGVLSWRLKSDSNLSLTQSVTKLYEIDPDTNEVQPADTVLRYERQLLKRGPYILKGRFSLTLPVSEYSKNNDVRTKPTLSLRAEQPFWGERLVLAATPYGRFYVNEFKTTRVSQGSGGLPLRRAEYGLSGEASLHVADNISLNTSLSYAEIYYEEIGKKNRVSPSGEKNLFWHNYSFDASAEVEVSKRMSVEFGYSQGDQVERAQGLQVVAYDPVTSQVYMGTSLLF